MNRPRIGLVSVAASVGLVSAVVLSLARDVGAQAATPSAANPRDLTAVESLIKTYGKKPIIEFLRARRSGRVTIAVDGRERESVGPPNEQFVTARTILRDLSRIPLTVEQFEQALKAAGPPAVRKSAITHEDAPLRSDADNVVFMTTCAQAEVAKCAEDGFRDRFATVNPDVGLGHYSAWQEGRAGGELENRLDFSGSYTLPSDLAPYHGSAAWACVKGECQVTLVIPKVKTAPQ
jgi:hypothetical protein